MPRTKTVKHIFVTGGVVSSIGKGILSASLGALLKSYGFRVGIQKYDPYINLDPGTISPYQHGEIFVTDDGAETDLDLGHYERFLGTPTSQQHNVTMGQIYTNILNKERRGDFLGQTVQVIPHVVDEIKHQMKVLGKSMAYDIIITEIGGTVGDIESSPFLEAIRQFRLEMGAYHALNIHLTLVPFIKTSSELKTKPTQHSVRMLLEIGVQPEILICRSEKPLPKEIKEKTGLFCNVDSASVISFHDVPTIYEAPIILHREGIEKLIFSSLKTHPPHEKPQLDRWIKFVDKIKHPSNGVVNIGLCGKYTEYPDAYKSILEAFTHAGVENDVHVKVTYIHAENNIQGEESLRETMKDIDGVLVAPGFGVRGIEGKIEVIQYTRRHNIPTLGICLGMQCAIIEYARNICNLETAHSTEFQKNAADPVIDIVKNQKKNTPKGGTMRLGNYPCVLVNGSIIEQAYKKNIINERHRHRYELNNAYRDVLSKHGILLSGVSPDNSLVEAIEIPTHRWFVGVQFHPELKSRVNESHPLFYSFIKASKAYQDNVRKANSNYPNE